MNVGIRIFQDTEVKYSQFDSEIEIDIYCMYEIVKEILQHT